MGIFLKRCFEGTICMKYYLKDVEFIEKNRNELMLSLKSKNKTEFYSNPCNFLSFC